MRLAVRWFGWNCDGKCVIVNAIGKTRAKSRKNECFVERDSEVELRQLAR